MAIGYQPSCELSPGSNQQEPQARKWLNCRREDRLHFCRWSDKEGLRTLNLPLEMGLRTVHIAVQRRNWRILPAIGFRRCQERQQVAFVDVIEGLRSLLCLHQRPLQRCW